jgi:hypothetical protein
MKSQIYAILLVSLFTVVINAQAQQPPPSAAETLENLRLQLIDVQTHEAELQARAQQLDEALKPENIERSLAGVGSTRPEELREARRKQLQIERDGVGAKLKVLETSRLRLEAAIRDAETRAYHESAQPPTQMVVAQGIFGRRLLYSGSATVAVAGLIAGFVVRRRLRKRRSQK